MKALEYLVTSLETSTKHCLTSIPMYMFSTDPNYIGKLHVACILWSLLSRPAHFTQHFPNSLERTVQAAKYCLSRADVGMLSGKALYVYIFNDF